MIVMLSLCKQAPAAATGHLQHALFGPVFANHPRRNLEAPQYQQAMPLLL
jgi:hypothetical protein